MTSVYADSWDVVSYSPAHAILADFDSRWWWLRMFGVRPLRIQRATEPAVPVPAGCLAFEAVGLWFLVWDAHKALKEAGHRIEDSFVCDSSKDGWLRARHQFIVRKARP